MPSPAPLTHAALLDLCDTLEALPYRRQDTPRLNRSLIDHIDLIRDCPQGNQHLYASDLLVRASAFINSAEADRQQPLFQQLLPHVFEQWKSITSTLADNDLTGWQEMMKRIERQRMAPATMRRQADTLLLGSAHTDHTFKPWEALGEIQLMLSELSLGQGIRPPTSSELFDLRCVRIQHSVDSKQKTCDSTTLYDGVPLSTSTSPIIKGPEGNPIRTVGDLALARRARELFYKGDTAQDISPLFEAEDYLPEAIASGLAKTRGTSYIDSREHARLSDRFQNVMAVIEEAAPAVSASCSISR